MGQLSERLGAGQDFSLQVMDSSCPDETIHIKSDSATSLRCELSIENLNAQKPSTSLLGQETSMQERAPSRLKKRELRSLYLTELEQCFELDLRHSLNLSKRNGQAQIWDLNLGISSREKLKTPRPLPPFLATKRHLQGKGGEGVYFEAPRGSNFIPSPLIHPPPLEGYFQGWGGG